MDHPPTVVVLGCSYGGHRAVNVLVNSLPSPWRIVVIERNTHANHLYVFPRIAIVPNHEHKAFIPYTNIFKHAPITSPDAPQVSDPSRHVLIHGHVTGLSPNSVSYLSLDPGSSRDVNRLREESVAFDYLVYALGSHLPAPINIWSEAPTHAIPELAPWERMSSIPSSPISPISASTSSSTPTSMFRLPFRAGQLSAAIRALGGLSIPSTPPAFRAFYGSNEILSNASELDVNHLNPFDSLAYPSSTKFSPEETNEVLSPYTNFQRGTKKEGIYWLRAAQDRVREAQSVLVIGGGALGVQFASDIAEMCPEKRVTLVHSGPQLLPRFDSWLHEESMRVLSELGVNVMLSSRVDLSTKSKRTLRTCDGRLISADLILLCTGQKPNTSLMASMAPNSVNPRSGMISVLRSMQLAYFERPATHEKHTFSCAQGLDEASCHCRQSFDFGLASPLPSPISGTPKADAPPHPDSPHPHIFVIGDAADAFGALNAGHTAWTQAEVAARNIVKLIKTDGRARLMPTEEKAAGVKITRKRKASVIRDLKENLWPIVPLSGIPDTKEKPLSEEEVLEPYEPPLPSIKVSLGLKRAIYQTNGKFGSKGPQDCPIDLAAPNMWKRRGLSTDDMSL